MKQILFAVLIYTLSIGCAKADPTDTTHVKILFDFNEQKLKEEEQQILKDISPADTSIVLKKIHIYGYADEKETGVKQLSKQRAEAVKQFLLHNGIEKKLLGNVEGYGSAKPLYSDQDEDKNNKCVIVMIEYEAKVVEETIIIQSTKKKKEE